MSAILPATAGRRWLMLAVLLVGQFMGLLDVLIVNVAMPVIGTRLHASGASLQLIVGGYTIAYAASLITAARLGDLYGRRRTYQVGLVLFTVASLACGLAPGIGTLIAFRVVQGAAAALMAPQIMSIIQVRFTGADRATALSAYGLVLSIGAVAGLVVGGALVSANLFDTGWRPAFLVNVPIGLILAVLVPRLVPADRPQRTRRLDLAGLAVAVPAVLLVVLPLVLGHEVGWPLWTFAAIGAGLVLSLAFAWLQRRIAAGSGDPLLDPGVLRAAGLPAGLLTLACMQVAYGGFLFVYTLHLQRGLGESPLRAGFTYLPMSVAFGIAGFGWRRLPVRFHHLVTPLGLALCTLGYLGIAASPHGGPLALTALTVAGAGMGLSASPLLTQALRHVPPNRAADASGLLNTTMQLGQVFGVAAFGTLYLALRDGHRVDALTTTCRSLAVLGAVGVLAAIGLARTTRPVPQIVALSSPFTGRRHVVADVNGERARVP